MRRMLAREFALLRSSMPVAKRATQHRPTFLGATVGATVGSITAAIVTWPIADIFLAPWFIKEGLLTPVGDATRAAPLAVTDVSRLRQLVGSVDDADGRGPAHLCVLTGGTREQRLDLAREMSRNRPTLRISLRGATAPHSMVMSVVESLYEPLVFSQLFSCLGTVWLTLFDMLISDHDHTRHRDLCVLLAQTSRALDMASTASAVASASTSAQPPRPLIVVEHLFVPMDAEMERGGEGLSPMLRTLRQWLCKASIDTNQADVLVLTPTGSASGNAAVAAWRGEARRSCANRITMSGGVVGIALTQSEAVDRWLRGCRLRQRAGWLGD